MVPQDLGVTLGRSREAERLRQDRRQPIRTFQQFARKCKIHIERSLHRARSRQQTRSRLAGAAEFVPPAGDQGPVAQLIYEDAPAIE